MFAVNDPRIFVANGAAESALFGKQTDTPDPASIHLSLTQQQKLDLPGSLFTVVPQIPVDHLAALLRCFVVRAQSTPHLLLI